VDSKGGYEPARAAAADIDMDAAAQPPSLAPVLSAVVIASFGALAFGFHLGVVNGPLEAIAADLGFAGNAGLQGTVRPVLALCTDAPGAQCCPQWLPVQQRSCPRAWPRTPHIPARRVLSRSAVNLREVRQPHPLVQRCRSCARPAPPLARGRQRWQELGPISAAGVAGAAPGGRKVSALAVGIAEGSLRAQVVSSLLAGAAVGSLGGSGLADSFGRRTTLLLDAVPMAVGALLSATATGLQVGPGHRVRVLGGAGRSREGTAWHAG
jgi:hypothetical protein